MPYSLTGLCGVCFWRRKMDTQTKVKPQRDNWSAWFRTIKKLRLPWIWIIIGLALNLGLNNLLLKLPDLTADLVSGKITGPAIGKAIMYYVVVGLMSFVAVLGQVQAQTYSIRRTRESVWKKMLSMRMEYFDRNDPTDMMSAVTNDASAAIKDLISVLIYLIPDIYYVVMALKRIGEYHWLLVVSYFFLFPDNSYGYTSGGQPEHITDLTYEKFIETHKRFYHPSNAKIIFDGHMNIERFLEYIDTEYLSKYDYQEPDFDFVKQEPKTTEETITYFCAVGDKGMTEAIGQA